MFNSLCVDMAIGGQEISCPLGSNPLRAPVISTEQFYNLPCFSLQLFHLHWLQSQAY